MKQQTPFFITITSEVLRDKDLNPIEKLIFTEIMALTYSCGYCYASNSHFADIFDRAVETISRNISKLQSKGYIYSEISQSDGNARKIFVKYTGQPFPQKHQNPLDENVNTSCQKHQNPLDENVKRSNTISKSISKSLKKDTASGSSFNENLVNLFMQEKYPYLEPITASTLKSFVNNILKEEQKQKGIEITKEHAYTFFAEIITKFFPNINENSVSANNAHTQTSYQGNLDNSTNKENLTVESGRQTGKNIKDLPHYLPEKEEVEVIPACIDISVWQEWVKHRKEKKQKLTPTTIKKQFQQLVKFHNEGQDVNAIIEQSITNGWTGLFAVKNQQAKQKPTTNRMITPQKIDIDLSEMEQFNFTTL
jgi:hypothetical protein